MLDKRVQELKKDLEQVTLEKKKDTTKSIETIKSLDNCQKILDDMFTNLDQIVTIIPKTRVVVNYSVFSSAADAGICQYFASDINGTSPAVINVPKSFTQPLQRAGQPMRSTFPGNMG